MTDYKYLFKIVLVGNAGVGKTCLVRQFTQGSVPSGHQGATIGVDFMIKTVTVNGIKVKLQLWDTAGQERFRSITQSYYRSAHCLILVYDISSQPSFDALAKWIKDVDAVIDRSAQLSASTSLAGNSGSSQVLRVLVGNKCDKEREIPSKIADKFADLHAFDMFVETSALDNDSVERLFTDVAQELARRRLADSTLSGANSLSNYEPGVDLRQSGASQAAASDNINILSVRAALTTRAKTCLQC